MGAEVVKKYGGLKTKRTKHGTVIYLLYAQYGRNLDFKHSPCSEYFMPFSG